MAENRLQIEIAAPVGRVFDTIAHIQNFSRAVPHIVNVEILSETQSGVGTRFRETREMRGREMTTELEITEYVKDKSVRIVSDEGGTIWDTLFTVESTNGGTLLTLSMDARPYKTLPKLVVPLMTIFLKKAVMRDMEAVKEYCEQDAVAAAG
ncbi:MAG: SRPBCC family protein [Rhodothermia bacterium]|nr:SRPBCC family protein [Rhodothermia bacterium]